MSTGWFGLAEDPDVGGVLTVDGPGRDVDDAAKRVGILALDDSYSVEGDVITLEGNSQLGETLTLEFLPGVSAPRHLRLKFRG